MRTPGNDVRALKSKNMRHYDYTRAPYVHTCIVTHQDVPVDHVISRPGLVTCPCHPDVIGRHVVLHGDGSAGLGAGWDD